MDDVCYLRVSQAQGSRRTKPVCVSAPWLLLLLRLCLYFCQQGHLGTDFYPWSAPVGLPSTAQPLYDVDVVSVGSYLRLQLFLQHWVDFRLHLFLQPRVFFRFCLLLFLGTRWIFGYASLAVPRDFVFSFGYTLGASLAVFVGHYVRSSLGL